MSGLRDKEVGLVGLEAASTVIEDIATRTLAVNVRGDSMPVVTLVCSKCFYVMHFAWMPIRNGDAID